MVQSMFQFSADGIVSIANVSGFIAVAVIAAQFLFPTLLVLAFSTILGHENNLVTWSVAGKLLQESWWPTLLRTDAVATQGVSRGAVVTSWAKTLGILLIAVAGVVTPLGLYDGFTVGETGVPTFSYVRDSGPFGYATPDRSNMSFIRVCSNGFGPAVCPGVNTPLTVEDFDNGTTSFRMPWGADGRIPRERYEYFGSGTRNSCSISGVWDIEYRQYGISTQNGYNIPINNGSEFVIGSYETFDNNILVPQVVAIEGLIVDAVNGGVGFRNHSIPNGRSAASTWSEDITFVEPETVCVPNNLTVRVSINATSVDNLSGAELVDLGGFHNMDYENFPITNGTDSQGNLDLYQRAYRAAFINNLITAWYFNVTDYADPGMSTPRRPRQYNYLDSEEGRAIPLNYGGSFSDLDRKLIPGRLRTTQSFSDYLGLQYPGLEMLQGTASAPNPFNLTRIEFESIFDDCIWFYDRNPGNISTVAVGCAMAYGLGTREGADSTSSRNRQPVVYRPGEVISIPLYTCASAVKASIKSVNFRLNGTDMSGLSVESISPKDYTNERVPTWAVENNDIGLGAATPIWGLVDPSLPAIDNVTTLQREHLYLPGLVINGTDSRSTIENMPGTDFHTAALTSIGLIATLSSTSSTIRFSTSQDITGAVADYSGQGNPALARRWRELIVDANGVSTALNLVWSDIVANMLVGTKGMTGGREDQDLSKRQELPRSSAIATPTVATLQRTVRYHWRFAIPAFMVLTCLVVVSVVATAMCIVHRTVLGHIRSTLYKTSAGRILGSYLYPNRCPDSASVKEWIERVGVFVVDYSGSKAMRNGIPEEPMVLQSSTKDADYFYGHQ